MEKTFRPYNPRQIMLMPPSLDDWLPENHLARFLGEAVDELDIQEIERDYDEAKGCPPYHPRMMLKILIYGYCTGVHSSRKLSKKCEDDVAFRYLAANNFPKFRAIADFRARHLKAFKKLFLQVLLLCKEAGLLSLGHVALDGTKLKANASKHKGTSYGRLKAEEQHLSKEIEALISQAQNADTQEDQAYGKDNRGDEIPKELRRKEDRLKKIREAKAALEARAADKEEKKGNDRDDSPPPAPPDKEQYNFTDPESRIMPRPDDKKAFFQGYNAQAVVNEEQIIVANDLVASPGDAKQLPTMMAEVRGNTDTLPEVLLADAGYFSEVNVGFLKTLKVKALIPPDREGRGFVKPNPGRKNATAKRMRKLLETEWGRNLYRQRKALAEPVFGQIKSCMGFSQFSLRGLAKVKAEWDLVCLCHNLRKLYRFQMNQG